jgi:hypothetical protein
VLPASFITTITEWKTYLDSFTCRARQSIFEGPSPVAKLTRYLKYKESCISKLLIGQPSSLIPGQSPQHFSLSFLAFKLHHEGPN